MNKRQLFIEQEKRFRKSLARKLEELTPMIYAAFAVSLHRRYGFGFHRISTAIADTQILFNRAACGEIDIITECLEETGIDIMSATTAKECGIKEGDKIV